MSAHAQAWAEANTPDEIPEPAPVRLSVAQGPRGSWDWCIGATHGSGPASVYAWGTEATLDAARETAECAAETMGLVPYADGWCSPPDSGLVPGPSA